MIFPLLPGALRWPEPCSANEPCGVAEVTSAVTNEHDVELSGTGFYSVS